MLYVSLRQLSWKWWIKMNENKMIEQENKKNWKKNKWTKFLYLLELAQGHNSIFVLQTGSIWKEDRGCTNCICIAGVSKCTEQICEVTSCEPGYHLVTHKDACCPVCEPTHKSCLDGTKLVSFLSYNLYLTNGTFCMFLFHFCSSFQHLFATLSNFPI